MKRLGFAIITVAAALSAQTLTVPAGNHILVTLTAPIWTANARPGTGVYGEVNYPVAANRQIMIPPGTKARGIVDIVILPTNLSGKAELRMRLTTLVFSNGYAVDLNQADTAASFATADIAVTKRSDLLLDHGDDLDFQLGADLTLLGPLPPVVRTPVMTWGSSSTRCVPIPPTPGEDPIVIPGTSGTPPTVIPGGPGQPDIVIPGTDPTPPTVIGGSPGTPGVACPAPPVVLSEPLPHHGSLTMKTAFQIGGRTLPKGRYQLKWNGIASTVDAQLTGPQYAGDVTVRIVATDTTAGSSRLIQQTAANGMTNLQGVQFKGQPFTVLFN